MSEPAGAPSQTVPEMSDLYRRLLTGLTEKFGGSLDDANADAIAYAAAELYHRDFEPRLWQEKSAHDLLDLFGIPRAGSYAPYSLSDRLLLFQRRSGQAQYVSRAHELLTQLGVPRQDENGVDQPLKWRLDQFILSVNGALERAVENETATEPEAEAEPVESDLVESDVAEDVDAEVAEAEPVESDEAEATAEEDVDAEVAETDEADAVAEEDVDAAEAPEETVAEAELDTPTEAPTAVAAGPAAEAKEAEPVGRSVNGKAEAKASPAAEKLAEAVAEAVAEAISKAKPASDEEVTIEQDDKAEAPTPGDTAPPETAQVDTGLAPPPDAADVPRPAPPPAPDNGQATDQEPSPAQLVDAVRALEEVAKVEAELSETPDGVDLLRLSDTLNAMQAELVLIREMVEALELGVRDRLENLQSQVDALSAGVVAPATPPSGTPAPVAVPPAVAETQVLPPVTPEVEAPPEGRGRKSLRRVLLFVLLVLLGVLLAGGILLVAAVGWDELRAQVGAILLTF